MNAPNGLKRAPYQFSRWFDLIAVEIARVVRKKSVAFGPQFANVLLKNGIKDVEVLRGRNILH